MATDADVVSSAEFWDAVDVAVARFTEEFIDVPPPVGAPGPATLPIDTALFNNEPIYGDGTNAASVKLVDHLNGCFHHHRAFTGATGLADAKRLLPKWTKKEGVTCSIMTCKVTFEVKGGYVRDVDGGILWYWGQRRAEGKRPVWLDVFRNPSETTLHGDFKERKTRRMAGRLETWLKK